MLISLTLLVAALLSWLSSIVSQIASPLEKPPTTPQDPTTLTLALIGAGSFGVYFAISRRAQRRRNATRTTGVIKTPVTEPEEHLPSRGAA
jgi:hypothetical protein